MRNLLVFEAIQYLRAAGRNDLADRLVAGDDMQAICNEILWPAESAGEREAA
ncbi:MAG TPA: hypothetical protein VHY35_17820 [Stellaceae bacterium]|nr:hypothetical protein [Stellaceae bacterium]